MSGGNRYNAKVTKDRYLRIWEENNRGYQNYHIDSGGRLRDNYGALIPIQICPVGVWITDTSAGVASLNSRLLSDPGAFFVEEAEYDAEMGTYTPTPRGQLSPLDVGRVLVA